MDIDLDFIKDCLKAAGEMAVIQRGQRIATVKADSTPVTVVDQQVETFLIERILARYPGHAVLSEESGGRPGERTYTWVIDPIDGTRAFASGLPIWGVSIGLLHDEQPVAGGLYLPVTGEMYWGTPGAAFYNDRPMPAIRTVDLLDPLAFLGVPSNFHLHFTVAYPRIRSLGSTAAHLAYVAAGSAVGMLTRLVSLWDLAGMLPVLAAVGVDLAYLSGEPFRASDVMDGLPIRQPLIAAHPSVLPLLREQITSIETA